MRNFLILLVLLPTLSLPACKTSDIWADGAETFKQAGLDLANEMVPVIAESAARHGAEAAATIVAAQVEKDEHLTTEEKGDIQGTLYGAGAATLASLGAALRMWFMLRAKKLALGIVTKAVDAVPESIGDPVKEMVASMGGNAPAVKAAISDAKA